MTTQSACMIVLLCGTLSTSVLANTPKEKDKAFKLEDGDYIFTISVMEGQDGIGGIGLRTNKTEVVVTVKGGKVTIENAKARLNLEGKLVGNEFSATMEKKGNAMELKGKLTADNTLSGTLSGSATDVNVTGTFELVKKKD